MKHQLVTGIAFMLLALGANAQLNTRDDLALKVPEKDSYSTTGISDYVKANFKSDSERVRALFFWVANNISYDVGKLRAQKKDSVRATANDILKIRKGVCQDHSVLLNELFSQCSIRSVVIGGYGKLPDGTIADLSHAWVAAEVNNKWYLFDATWSAGWVKDERFTKRYSDRYYKVLPEEMIKDHMPFDPMYQFLNYPLTYNEFNEARVSPNTSKAYFNYADTLKQYNLVDTINQSRAAARRIRSNGFRKRLVEEMLEFLSIKQESKFGYNEAATQFRLAITLYNRYIACKNSRFSCVREDKEIQQMVDSVWEYIMISRTMLSPVVADNDEHRKILIQLQDDLFKFSQRVDEEKIFIKRYLQKDKSSRKTN